MVFLKPVEQTGETRQQDKLLASFADRITANTDLTRSLVSWQSNIVTTDTRSQ